MVQVPQDLPIFERDAVRVVVRDSEEKILCSIPTRRAHPNSADGGSCPEAVSTREKPTSRQLYGSSEKKPVSR